MPDGHYIALSAELRVHRSFIDIGTALSIPIRSYGGDRAVVLTRLSSGTSNVTWRCGEKLLARPEVDG